MRESSVVVSAPVWITSCRTAARPVCTARSSCAKPFKYLSNAAESLPRSRMSFQSCTWILKWTCAARVAFSVCIAVCAASVASWSRCCTARAPCSPTSASTTAATSSPPVSPHSRTPIFTDRNIASSPPSPQATVTSVECATSGRRLVAPCTTRLSGEPDHLGYIENQRDPPIAEDRGSGDAGELLQHTAQRLDNGRAVAFQHVHDEPDAALAVAHDDDALPLGVHARQPEHVAQPRIRHRGPTQVEHAVFGTLPGTAAHALA